MLVARALIVTDQNSDTEMRNAMLLLFKTMTYAIRI